MGIRQTGRQGSSPRSIAWRVRYGEITAPTAVMILDASGHSSVYVNGEPNRATFTIRSSRFPC